MNEGRPHDVSLKHELRTPLNQIIGYTEMLLEEAEDRQENDFRPELQKVHAAGRQLLSVIDGLFEPGKGGSDRIDLDYLHHEVRTPLNQIIGYTEMMQEDASERGISSFIPDLGKIHLAARRLLDLVVEELIPSREQGMVQSQTTEPIASIVFRREAAAGSISMPDRTQATAKGENGFLLVVDDNDGNRDMLSRRLERLGYKVAHAENGRDAMEKIREQSFDLVLLDILMPVMNGYEVLAELKSDPVLRALPVIVLSASDESQSVVRCIQMGAEDHIRKPFDPVLLQARISACLDKKRFRDREVSYLRQIEEEKQRSDELLHIILPRDVAAELKNTNAVKPRRFEQVGVMFCDIVGFTAFSEGQPPEVLWGHLQTLVENFEHIASKYELEKIKTIGDAFMATAGLLMPLPNPALNCVRCGLEMIQAAKDLPPHWTIRVGVHLGPVVAGVVGRKKYQYDIWGDTVNTAARMEQAAGHGSICVSSETWQAVAPFCRGRSQGLIQIKGKGELELYCIEGLESGRAER